jgi:hypothetical protein
MAAAKTPSSAGADFPIDLINNTIRKAGHSAEFDDFAWDEMLARTYGQQQPFLALSLLHDDAGWGTKQFPPRSHLCSQSVQAKGAFNLREARLDR